MEELVSIIMPSYNTSSFIVESIKSVQKQTYTNWELIIVDDCSTDNTCDILSQIHDDRIIRISNTSNSGAAICRNKALKIARGKWIAFLDSDDLWHPEKLEKQISFMRANGYHFTYTNYEEMSEQGMRENIIVTGPLCITKRGMFNYCWPGCLTVMYDAEYIGKVQINDIRKNNDYALWLTICKKSNCYLLKETLAYYRRNRKGSISNHNVFRMIVWHYKLYRTVEEQNIALSLLNTCRNLIFGLYKKKKYVIKKG